MYCMLTLQKMPLKDQIYWSLPFSNSFNVASGKMFHRDNLEILPNTFVVAPFVKDQYSYLLCNNLEQLSLNQLLNLPKPILPNSESFLCESTLANYDHLVSEALMPLKKGMLQKVVLSAKHSIEYTAELNWNQKLVQLRTIYPNAFILLLISKKLGNWLVATPELLLKKQGQDFTSHALAGTKLSPASLDDFGSKERQEQEVVTQQIESVFNELNLKVNINPLQIKEAGSISHLLTVIKAKWNQNDVFNSSKLIEKLHPTPAVGGVPKDASIDFIKNYELYKRQLFTGFIGYVTDTCDFELYVNLRTAQISNSAISFYAGAGITAASNPTDEASEIKAKMNILAQVLLSKPL